MPVYNRYEDVKFAVFCLLEQSFKDFELLLCDDMSSENIEKITGEFKDKRIKYFRNKKNLGWIKNTEEGINKAKGKYVILHGNDDFMIDNNLLQELQKVLRDKSPGYIRINYYTLSPDRKNLINYIKLPYDNQSFAGGQNNIKTVDFILKTDPFFITGVVFKKSDTVSLANSELAPWLDYLFEQTRKYGALYLARPGFVGNWSSNNHPFNYTKNGKFTFELYLEWLRTKLDDKNYMQRLHEQMLFVVKAFPLTKLKKGNKNLLICARRVKQLYPDFQSSVLFWFIVFASLVTPRFIISFARKCMLRNTFKNNLNTSLSMQSLILLKQKYESQFS